MHGAQTSSRRITQKYCIHTGKEMSSSCPLVNYVWMTSKGGKSWGWEVMYVALVLHEEGNRAFKETGVLRWEVRGGWFVMFWWTGPTGGKTSKRKICEGQCYFSASSPAGRFVIYDGLCTVATKICADRQTDTQDRRERKRKAERKHNQRMREK